MQKFGCVILALVLIFSFFACSGDTTETTNYTEPDINENLSSRDEFYRDHQELMSSESDFNADTMLRIDIPEVGLENVYIRQVSERMLLDTETIGAVYLIADDRYGGNRSTSDYYLLVTVNDKLYVKDLIPEEYNSPASMDATLYFADLDGDKDKEILLQETKGMSGGAGQYLSRVYNFTDGEIKEIFTSHDDENRYFNTGFDCMFLENHMLKIDNTITGYTTTFEVVRENEKYFTWWYDDDGDLKDITLWVDSFNRFKPEDVDDDGISEIVCRQYTCLNGHADYVGSAMTVLKYNSDTKAFYVYDAWFEPAEN